MLDFKNITLCCIDSLDIHRAAEAMKHCTDVANFADALLISPDINSKEDYSKFVLTELPGIIKTDFVLIVQYDGYIINPAAWTDEFLQYDYIGAPWWFANDNNVGNGGFSLRSKKMLEACKKIYPYHPEDAMIRLFRPGLEAEGIKFAPEELAARFSWEHNGKYEVYNNSFGFHGTKPNV